MVSSHPDLNLIHHRLEMLKGLVNPSFSSGFRLHILVNISVILFLLKHKKLFEEGVQLLNTRGWLVFFSVLCAVNPFTFYIIIFLGHGSPVNTRGLLAL